jgi:serine/threonine protein kinase
MKQDSLATFVSALRDIQVLDEQQLGELENLQSLFPEPGALAQELFRRGALTAFQIEQLQRGLSKGLVLGQYVLLERLGEGGMGAVYKARHQRMKRLVALKVIRKDIAVGPQDVRRFTQEIEAAAQLAHPNVVMAFDANEIDGTLFFVMEYVEGTDLGHLVQRTGPLAIPQACDCIRQAACGLAHAHERGLVHRDIKPSNLLLTYADGVVKVLDLGLARLHESAQNSQGSLTGTGVIMGTPDFMSPEQGRDSHRVDARSDLYSLGCTLYYLLTKSIPFPGGTVTEKLLKHIMDPPRPLIELRSEVPAKLAAVVEKLMAKSPEERYQTASQVIAALAPFAAAPRSAEQYRAAPQIATDIAENVPATLAQPQDHDTASYHSSQPGSLRPAAKPASSATDCDPVPREAAASAAAAAWRPSVPRRRRNVLLRLLLLLLLIGGSVVGIFFLNREPVSQTEPETIAAAHAGPTAPAPAVAETKPAAVVTPLVEPKAVPPTLEMKIASGPAEVAPKEPPPVSKSVPPEPKPLLGVLAHFDRPQQASSLRTALSANGEWAVVSFDFKIHIWHIRQGKRQDRADETLGVSHVATALAVLGDGSRVLMGRPADDPRTPLDRVAPVLPFVSVWDPLVSRHEHLLPGNKSDVTAVALSAKGNFALSGGADRSVRLWDLANRTQKAQLGSHEQKVGCVAFAADGVHGLSGGWDGQVILWDLENGTKLAPLHKHKSLVTSVAFAPDGRHALSADYDGTICMYDVQQRRVLRSFAGHTDAVKCLAFAPDNEHFLSGGEDRTLRLWDVKLRENVKCFDEHNVAVLSAAVSADGKYAMFICADQTIRRCELPELRP